ncbi:MAG: response regulator [Bacteroidota bacterium]
MNRILLVDDDTLVIKIYQSILKNSGFELEVATTGNEMLSSLAVKKPDVILLDVILPDHNGLELCKQVKNDPAFSTTKIILVSGREISPVQVAEGIEMGADDYLVKPFHPKELLARLKNCLKLKQTEEALRQKNTEMKKLYNHLQHVREEERKIIAREVQEELGQITAVLKMDIDWLAMQMPDEPKAQKERMLNASFTTKHMIEHIRSIASSLRPSMLDELGLYASLEAHCRKMKSVHGIDMVFKHDDREEGLTAEIKTVVYRICQEALMNVIQHADAVEVTVYIQLDKQLLQLRIVDNGKGFDIASQENVLGLISMRERALSVNGHFQIDSILGEGTTVSLSIPCQ